MFEYVAAISLETSNVDDFEWLRLALLLFAVMLSSASLAAWLLDSPFGRKLREK